MSGQDPTYPPGYPNQPSYLASPPPPSRLPSRRRGVVVGALGLLGGAVAGAVIATSVNAGAATSGSATSGSSAQHAGAWQCRT
jgi:hypothetical protein